MQKGYVLMESVAGRKDMAEEGGTRSHRNAAIRGFD